MAGNDLYIILEVERTASVNDIKRAFRKLARRFHPDINPGDQSAEDRFKRITEAYDVLSDPLKREFYDVNGFYSDGVLETHRSETSWGFSFQGFSFNRSPHSEFSEIFGIGNLAARRDPVRGQDLEYPISISFEESISGRQTRITIARMDACPLCNGTGQAAGSQERTCVTCGGTAKTTRAKGHLQFSVTCADCGGTGRSIIRCGECGGEGRFSRTQTVEVDLPPGVGA